jgi:DNA-binding MarR family transcriptional regulator
MAERNGVPPTGLVWRLSMRWRAAIDRAITPLGLTHAQYAVLAPLLSMERAGQRPSQRQLADFTGLEPLYVSKLARALEQAGLIERTGNPDDTRAVQLALTDRGRTVATRAVEQVRGLQDELTAPLGGLRSPATRALIESLRTLLEAPASAGQPAPPGKPPARAEQTGENR